MRGMSVVILTRRATSNPNTGRSQARPHGPHTRIVASSDALAKTAGSRGFQQTALMVAECPANVRISVPIRVYTIYVSL